MLSCNLFLLGEQKVEANTKGKIYFFTLIHNSLITLVGNWVQILAVLMHLSIINAAFVPHNMIPGNGDPFHFIKFRYPPD